MCTRPRRTGLFDTGETTGLKLSVQWGSRGTCPELAMRGECFCCTIGLAGAWGGDCAIRDQNKGLRLSFVQGLLLTHF